jgi:hypothetical protein
MHDISQKNVNMGIFQIMSTHRFEVTRVSEPNLNNPPDQPSEITPFVSIEHEIPPPPPPLPASMISTNAKNSNRIRSKTLSSMLLRKSLDPRRRASTAAAMASTGNQLRKISSADVICKQDPVVILSNPVKENEIDESDVYSTTQSNNNDTNHSRIPNKFLQELRSKRRELLGKAKNISIDQRIDFYRRENQRSLMRAQDIFDVHFESVDEEDNIPFKDMNIFTEESQEKIRKDIYNVLDNQRKKQYHKRHRHLLLGRSLLIFMTLLLTLMSFTLICVMIDVYDRAKHLDVKLPENEFIPMIFDKKTNLY